MRHVLRALLMLIAFLVLAACGQTGSELTPEPTPEPTPEATGYTVSGTVTNSEPGYVPQGVVLLMADTDLLTTLDVVEVIPGLYASEVAPVSADGSFELVLPSADELPEGVLVPAADFVRFLDFTCGLTASTPSASVSQYAVIDDGLFLPGVAYLSLHGPLFGITTTEVFDFDADEGKGDTFVSWVFATEDVTVDSGEAGCDIGGALHVAIDLVAGWNEVAFSFEVDPETDTPIAAHLKNFDGEELYFNVMHSF